MVSLSKELEEAMWGDAAILRYLELGRKHFVDGERGALMDVLSLCARFQAVIPDWATDALLDIQDRLDAGELADFNEAFGWAGERKDRRKKTARQARLRGVVLQELQAARLRGASLSPDDMFDEVTSKLAADGLAVSRRDVEDIYRQHGQFVKKLPRKPKSRDIFGHAHMSLPVPRRSGRSILTDVEK